MQIQDLEEGKGVKVKDVDDNTPASKAGIKEGDVITNVNGKEIEGVDDLRKEVGNIKEGDVLKFNYKRDGKNESTEVKIPKKLKTADL
jgi:serine protease Do